MGPSYSEWKTQTSGNNGKQSIWVLRSWGASSPLQSRIPAKCSSFYFHRGLWVSRPMEISQRPGPAPAAGKWRLAPAPRPSQVSLRAAEVPIPPAAVAEAQSVGLKIAHGRSGGVPTPTFSTICDVPSSSYGPPPVPHQSDSHCIPISRARNKPIGHIDAHMELFGQVQASSSRQIL
jgi:hypothetical protein